MKKKIKNFLKKLNIDEKILYYYKMINCFFISDKEYYKRMYYKIFNRELNIFNPKTFNEKIIKRILFDENPSYAKLTDKFLVRDYIKNKIGEKYLIKLYGVYNSIDEINFRELPNQFVLKCTHDSGSVIICNNKEEFNFTEARKKLKFYLKRNFYYMSREKHYKNIIPRIICEEKLKDSTDFKIHCFNGKPFYLEVVYDREKKIRRNIYNIHWELMPFQFGEDKNTEEEKEKPEKLSEILWCAEKLSQDFDYCRVDLYNNNGQIKFGEITFTPCSGLDKIKFEIDLHLGELWKNKEEN